MTLDQAAAAYRAAHHALATAHARALAASQAHTAARSQQSLEAMRAAWQATQKAMHAEWEAKDALAQAALDATATPTLDLEEVA